MGIVRVAAWRSQVGGESGAARAPFDSHPRTGPANLEPIAAILSATERRSWNATQHQVGDPVFIY